MRELAEVDELNVQALLENIVIYIEKEREMPTQDDAIPEVTASKPLCRAQRVVDWALGFANAAVLGLSIAFSSGAFQTASPPTQVVDPVEEATGNNLWKTLGSEAFAAFQRNYIQEKIQTDLAEAEALKAQAAAAASETKQAAEKSAEATRLEASYDGVAQRYHRPEGFEITLNYPVTVEKEKTEFGFKAIATPTTERGTVRVYVNLASASEGYVPAGRSIGTVGQYPVGEGVKAF